MELHTCDYSLLFKAHGITSYRVALSRGGPCVFWDGGFSDLTGLTPENVRAPEDLEVLFGMEYGAWRDHLESVLLGGGSQTWEHALHVPLGGLRIRHTICAAPGNFPVDSLLGLLVRIPSSPNTDDGAYSRAEIPEHPSADAHGADHAFHIQWLTESDARQAAHAWFKEDGPVTCEGFARDITERTKLREAEMVSEAKSKFLAAMSHEIRTPLNAITGFTHLLGCTKMNALQREYLEKVRSSASILLELANVILDFSRIEAGKMETTREPFSIAEIMTSLSAMFTHQANEKGLKFSARAAGNVPRYLIGDSLHFKQVLINLVSNAVKFTDAGEVAVRCSLREKRDRDITLKVTVRDTGIGMSREDISKVFVPFFQTDNSALRRHGGTGLGLPIAKSLVEVMGGVLTVTSEVGKGTVFAFTVRMKLDAGRRAARDARRLVVPKFRPQDVLLVEDNAINRRIASVLLRHANLRAVEAENGEEAVDLITRREKPFALVLMDIQMPVMDGLQATRLIRAAEERAGNKHRTPIVAMTAHTLDSERCKCMEAGMDGHIGKPIDVVCFYATLAGHLKQEKKKTPGMLPL